MQIVDQLERHLNGGGIYKRKKRKRKTTLGLAKEKVCSGAARENNSHSNLNRQSH